jgi:DNA-binding NarL/FixJ family response regulator
MRILLVEDEALLAATMDKALTEAGHNIVGSAREQAEAVQMAGLFVPQLALVDLSLARGTSGAEAAQEILRAYGVPSMFVSATPANCREATDVAALGCLSKPFTDDELVEAVRVAQSLIEGASPHNLPGNLDVYRIG